VHTTLAPVPAANVVGQTPLDLASGYVLGEAEHPPIPAAPDGRIHDVLIETVSAHMRAGRPYRVAFSGGRESSVDLALATRAARLGGFPEPVPVTLRYPGLTTEREVSAQERVVRHLGLADWERVEIHDELELVGPVAQRVLRDVGLLWPAQAHSMFPLMELARGGAFSLMTGANDFFLFWPWASLAAVLRGERRPRPADLGMAAMALAPQGLRAAAARRKGYPPAMPWMRPEAERRARKLMSLRAASVPARFDRAVRAQAGHRCGLAAQRSLRAMAAEAGTELVQVSFEPHMVAAEAAAGGWRGFSSKLSVLELAVGDLLPLREWRGPRPIDFTRVFFGEHTRAFARRWSGQGLDDSLVDAERLRSIWLGDAPDARTAGLMQMAWMHDEGKAQRSAAGPVTAAA
jgi:asparagine synthase (glutamine-hydrolysing)